MTTLRQIRTLIDNCETNVDSAKSDLHILKSLIIRSQENGKEVDFETVLMLIDRANESLVKVKDW